MIRVNDKWDVSWRDGMTIRDVLQACKFTHHAIVVSVNGVVVPPSEYASTQLTDGDLVRVVHVIGGG
jgi:sulfur carrier protein